MEEYFQEAGRAGRDGLPAEATICYNSYDISKAKRGIQDTMIQFVKSTSDCKHQIIPQYFGYNAPVRKYGGHNCCDHRRNICSCHMCTESHSQEPERVDEHDSSSIVATANVQVSVEQRELIRQKLLFYRDGLGSLRSCVGSVSLSTGFSLQLVDMAVDSIEHLHSVETILSSLPFFSEDNARVILKLFKMCLVSHKIRIMVFFKVSVLV